MCVCVHVRSVKAEMRKTEARLHAICTSEPPGAGPAGVGGLIFLFLEQAPFV